MNFEDYITANAYDDLPLWSAVPGLLLLENIKLMKNSKILDIGCGTGFPTIEIAQRMGDTSIVYGVDIWEKGIEKAKEKASNKNVINVKFIKTLAENTPFKDEYFDEIVSNNGFNGKNANMSNFKEIYRVLKGKGTFCFTAILPNSMKVFYKILYYSMKKNNVKNSKEIISKHIKQKRLSLYRYKQLLKNSGFKKIKISQKSFNIKFVQSEAFWKYFFFRLNFINGWINIIPKNIQEKIITEVNQRIDKKILKKGSFSLKISCVCIVTSKKERKKYE